MIPTASTPGLSMPRRECVTLRDMTDCLLQAYDCVARRAYQIFLERGGTAGGELDDWLSAEKELLGSLVVDLAEGEDYVSALASLPGLSGEEIEIGIDPRWLVILGRRPGEYDSADFYPDPHRVAEFSRAVHTDARTLHLASPNACAATAGKENNVETDSRSQENAAFSRATPACTPQASAASANQPEPISSAAQSMNSSVTSSSAAPDGPRGARTANTVPASLGSPGKLFCVLELPAEVDPERSVAVLANGLLGIRMPKAGAAQGPAC